MKFNEFDLDEKILQGVEEAGFTDCTPVQERTFKYALAGKDVAVQSQTGTGKTAAFLIPIFNFYADKTKKIGKTLIVVPTRELAVQIEEEAQMLSKYLDIKIASIYGGIGYAKQEDNLKEGMDIIIGTPGRLIDFGKSGKLNFSDINVLVIDEADRLFDMGFIPDLRWMLNRMPPKNERTTMLFSATLNSRVRHLAWEHMNDPEEIEVAPENITVEEIEQVLYHVSTDEKFRLLLGILRKENPASAIIFSNTKHKAADLTKRLTYNGYKCSCLMGDLPQKKRLSIINKVKAGGVELLVATDVAARGLHINDLEMVINYDLPEDYENYVHRIGRTARAGKTGKAVSLACEKYVYGLAAIENYIKMKIPVEWADEAFYGEDKSEGIRFSHDKNIDRRGGSRAGTASRIKTAGRAAAVRKNPDKTPYQTPKKPVQPYQSDAVRKKRSPRPASQPAAAAAARQQGKPDYRKEMIKKETPGKPGAPFAVRKEKKAKDSRSNQTIKDTKKRDRSLDERLKYYREKYGEKYTAPPEVIEAEKKGKKTGKKSLFKIIGSIFKK